MKFFLSLIFFLTYIQASNLLTYNVYERSDRVDVMLSFDAPHEGTIAQKSDASSITLSELPSGSDAARSSRDFRYSAAKSVAALQRVISFPFADNRGSIIILPDSYAHPGSQRGGWLPMAVRSAVTQRT